MSNVFVGKAKRFRIEVAPFAALTADWIVWLINLSLSPKVSAGAGAFEWTKVSAGAGALGRGGKVEPFTSVGLDMGSAAASVPDSSPPACAGEGEGELRRRWLTNSAAA